MPSVRLQAFFLFLLILPGRPLWAEKRSMHILWLMHKDHDFWHLSQQVAADAAQDLGITASFVYTIDNDRASFSKVAIDALESLKKDPGTEYFLAMPGNTPMLEQILQKAALKQIQVFFYNSKPHVLFTPRTGAFGTVLGGLFPDDRKAAYLQAQYLIREARKLPTYDASAPVRIIGIGGWGRDGVDADRRLGLEQAIREENAVLEQYFYTRWSPDVAKDIVIRARNRYPQSFVFWTIADYLAIASLEALKLEKDPFLFGGIDWSTDALQSMQSAKGMTVSVGGHFLDPGLVTVILYDFFKGLDFKQIEPACIMESRMALLDRNSVKKLLQRFPGLDWSQIDFKKISLYQSGKTSYDSSLNALLNI